MRRCYSQRTIKRVDVESQLFREGRLLELRELVNSEERTAETVGQAIRRLLESRSNHSHHVGVQHQHIAFLQDTLETRVSHNWGTARRLNQLVG
jgi:hypothetical protein